MENDGKSIYTKDDISCEYYIAHYGVKGQTYGVRRYQNEDGSLTTLGRIHYGVGKARAKISEINSKIDARAKNQAIRDEAVAEADSQVYEAAEKKKQIKKKSKSKDEIEKLKEDFQSSKDERQELSVSSLLNDNSENATKETKPEIKVKDDKGQYTREYLYSKPIEEMTKDELDAYKARVNSEKDAKTAEQQYKKVVPNDTEVNTKDLNGQFTREYLFSKKIEDMTREELDQYKQRLNIEKSARELEKQYKEYQKAQAEASKPVVVRALKRIGKLAGNAALSAAETFAKEKVKEIVQVGLDTTLSKEFITSLEGKLKEKLPKLTTQEMRDKLAEEAEAAKDAAKEVKKAAKEVAKEAKEAVKKTESEVKEAAKEAEEAAKKTESEVKESTKEDKKAAKKAAKEAAKEAKRAAKEAAKKTESDEVLKVSDITGNASNNAEDTKSPINLSKVFAEANDIFEKYSMSSAGPMSMSKISELRSKALEEAFARAK